MIEQITPARWASLKSQIGGNAFIVDHIKCGETSTACSIGIDSDINLHLLINIADDSVPLPPDLKGICVRYIDSGDLAVDVSANVSLEPVISPLFEEIINGCLDGRNPIDVISDRLDQLRKAFSRANSGIGESKQVGLVGELLVLKYVMIPTLGSRAVSLWSGPFAERHDFVGEGTHLEVKSTTKSMDQHEISRYDQLWAPKGKKLLLASVQLERSVAGTYTIATLRTDIITSLGDNYSAIDSFEDKLGQLGWHEGLIQSGTLLQFNTRSLSFFDIAGNFPRLPEDYVLPRGIVALSYTINVSACPILEPSQVMQLVEEM